MKTRYTLSLSCCFVLTGLMVSIGLQAQTSQTIFTTSGSFTIPAGVTDITVELWGGGGGAANNSPNPSGGGGGGGYARQIMSGLTPGNMLSVTVGTGGASGAPGNPSTIDGMTFANGGAPGSGTTGGMAGSFSGSPNAGSSGGNGADASGSDGGGGGGAGGSGSSGFPGVGLFGGAGGSASGPYGAGGAGGDGGAIDFNGQAGISPGGGGGGNGEVVISPLSSGAGADGLVIIHYCLPVDITVCPSNISVNVDAGMCTAVVNYTVEADNDTAMVFDFAGPVNNSGNGTGSGLMFPVGVTTVTVTALNDCSEEDCVFTVTVTDNEPPVIDCPDDVVVACDADLDPENNMALGEATATDNCPNVGTPSYMDAAQVPGVCPIYREFTRTWSVQDDAGNPANCTQVISLLDDQAPEVTFPNDIRASLKT